MFCSNAKAGNWGASSVTASTVRKSCNCAPSCPNVARASALGLWKRFDRLRQYRLGWNHKRVYRAFCAMRQNLKRKVLRRVLTRERQPLLASSELNRVWALDFMRDTLYDGRPFRTLNVIDEGNR